MSEWTSKYAIRRDLSAVQGRVPGSLEGTIKAGEKPPALNITEETEEEYFDRCSDDEAAEPNFSLIKHMLNVVRETHMTSDDEGDNTIGTVSKLNPESAEFIPKNNVPLSPKPPTKVRQKKTNIAVESILQALGNKEKLADSNDTMILLKPDHFIGIDKHKTPQNAVKETVLSEVDQEENGWLETQKSVITTKIPKKTPPKLSIQGVSMFKKKNASEKAKAVEKRKIAESKETNGTFKPSSLAVEYYEKFLERSKIKEAVNVDIWTKAEQKMREIDERRILEVVSTQSSSNTSASLEQLDYESEENSALETSNEIDQKIPDGSSLEKSNGTRLEISDGTSLEKPNGTGLEKSNGTRLEIPDGTSLEKPNGTGLEKSNGINLEKPNGTGFEKTNGTGLEKINGTGLEKSNGANLEISDATDLEIENDAGIDMCNVSDSEILNRTDKASIQNDLEIPNERILKMIALPQNRHELLEENEVCVVCEILAVRQ